MSCHHIMIDLETEGTRAGCVIRQIGAASFNPFTGEVDRTFEMNLDVEEQRSRFGLVSDPKTLVWLQALPANIQEAMTRDPKPVGEVIMALIRAFDWSHPEMRLWCHGATFDEPILRELIVRFGTEVGLKDLVPWGYLKARCTRDRLEIAGVKVERDAAKSHTGLEDCIKQIKALSEATRIIEGWKKAKAEMDVVIADCTEEERFPGEFPVETLGPFKTPTFGLSWAPAVNMPTEPLMNMSEKDL